MLEFLYSLDKTIFDFCNQTLSNPIFDLIMPTLTNWNQSWIGLGLAGGFLLLLIWRGGKKGRIAAVLLIPIIIASDQISSSIIKTLVARPRPCHLINGLPVLENIHLLVPCGGGYSFPSSHAANNFAFATLISFFYRRWSWIAFIYAGLMAFSRVSVGVHYPSDIIGGALVGMLCAAMVIILWEMLSKRHPTLSVNNETSNI